MAKLLLAVAAATFLLLLIASAADADASPTTLLAASGKKNVTAYEMLERYGFPRGVLPEGVQSYVLRPDGSFEVLLSGDGCEFLVRRRYLIRYDRRVAGNARTRSIRELEGVSVKVFFVWLPISRVERAGDKLSFAVGPLSVSFPVVNFAKSPHCRSAVTGAIASS